MVGAWLAQKREESLHALGQGWQVTPAPGHAGERTLRAKHGK